MTDILEQTRLAREAILSLIESLSQKVGQFLPNLIGALLVFIFGFIVASIAKKIFKKMFSVLGFNYIAEKSGVNQMLEKLGTTKKAIDILVSLIYFTIILLFFVAASEVLGIRIVIDTVNQFITYLPKIFGALFIFIFISYIAKLVGNLIKNLFKSSEIAYASFIGTALEIVINIFGLVIAIRKLGFDTTIFTANITLFLGIFLGAIGLSLGLGGKSIAEKILAGFYLKNILDIGSKIEVDKFSGKIRAFNPTNVLVETEEGNIILIPNDLLLKNKILSKK